MQAAREIHGHVATAEGKTRCMNELSPCEHGNGGRPRAQVDYRGSEIGLIIDYRINDFVRMQIG